MSLQRVVLRFVLAVVCVWSVGAFGVEESGGSVPEVDANPGLGFSVAPVKGSDSAALAITLDNAEKDRLEFRTLETVIHSGGDFGLFRVKLDAPEQEGWQVEDGRYAYRFVYPEGLTVGFVGQVKPEGLFFTYTVLNDTGKTLENVLIHPCLTTTDAPGFFPEYVDPDPRVNAMGDKLIYPKLLDRVWLWKDGEAFAMSSDPLGTREPHLAFMPEGEAPLQWAWWTTGTRTFDEPLLAIERRDKLATVALSFRDAGWASCNAGDDRACVHLFPAFGTLADGEKAEISGWLYVVKGDAEAAYAYYCARWGRCK